MKLTRRSMVRSLRDVLYFNDQIPASQIYIRNMPRKIADSSSRVESRVGLGLCVCMWWRHCHKQCHPSVAPGCAVLTLCVIVGLVPREGTVHREIACFLSPI